MYGDDQGEKSVQNQLSILSRFEARGKCVGKRPKRRYTKGWSLYLRHFVELREEGVKENFLQQEKVFI